MNSTKNLLFICLLLAGLTMKAQTLEHIYIPSVSYTKVASNESYYYSYNSGLKQMIIYSSNHSLYKVVNIPIQDTMASIYTGFSKTMFNSDNKIEFGVITSYVPVGGSYMVFNEDGTQIFRRDSTSSAIFYNTPTGAKMIININNYTTNKSYSEIYSLTGTVFAGKKEIDPTSTDILPYPNPTNNIIHLIYSMPEGMNTAKLIVNNLNGVTVKEFTVDRSFNDIILQAGELPSGIYLYGLEGEVMKKFIIE